MKKRRESSSPNNHLSDHISDLPDHILISFLDLLPANVQCKQAFYQAVGSTSVLSFLISFLMKKTMLFSNFVNSFFRFHKELTIKRIRFSFCSGDELNSHTEEWIEHVMRRKIEELHISFSTRQLYANELFPFGLLVQNREEKQYSFESLKLSPCTAFSSLRILCLDCVDISDGMLHGLLSALQVIESIKLINCDRLTNLKVMSPPVSLKNLELRNCSYLEVIEIYAPNLLSFVFFGDYPQCIFNTCLPSLLDVTLLCADSVVEDLEDLGSWYELESQIDTGLTKWKIKLPQTYNIIFDYGDSCELENEVDTNLIDDIAHVKSLKISVRFFLYMIAGANNLEWLHNLFINLEELEIFGFYCGEETMFFVIDILLRSAPHLKKLILRDFESWGAFPRLEEADYNAWVPPDCLINNLRMIKLNMFRGCDEGVDLVELLLKSLEALESLIIMVDSGIFRRENGREVVKDADKLMGICRTLLTLPRASMDAKIIISPYDRI